MMKFNDVYKNIVLNESYKNWKKHFLDFFFQENKAHLIALHEGGIVDSNLAKELKRGIKKIETAYDFPNSLPEETEDIFFVFERKLEEIIGKDKAGFLHAGRSRNDLDTTVFRMFMREKLLAFLVEVQKILEELKRKIAKNLETAFILYTHGQPAQVSTFGHYLSSFAFELLEDAEKILDSIKIVNRCPAGAAAITTSGFNINRKLLSELLGFDEPVPNSYQAISTSHWITYPATAVRIILEDIGRFVADLFHKASIEVGIVAFPNNLVQISSIMPQKRNPVILEHIRIYSELASEELMGLSTLFRNVPYQDVNEVADTSVVAFEQAIEHSRRAIRLFNEVLKSVEVNVDRCKEVATATGSTTTELADELVRTEKISFRIAHKVVSRFVESGFSYEVLKNSFASEVGREISISPEEVDNILSEEHFIEVRKVYGGPALEGMTPIMELFSQKQKRINDSISQILKQFRRYKANLVKKFESI
ncbi:argininosuccinate lyase [Kosmotoga pacifica]|uniref:argininosuccinate lyase n=1 Tax=Kosmotoga pacifica TaxID=1330330 RepID=A0A0G2Z7M2_9BACT|nr:argininosuccinate lyase [Kosmotoga pacifica]AKI97595.1 hypothetical protein IX53_06930 [Kosmotoga pacifica]